MTATFADFVSTVPNTKNQINLVLEYTQKLCEVLRCNYQSQAIQRHRDCIEKNGVVDESYVPWHQEQIDKLSMGEGVDEFTFDKGRKYYKVIRHSHHSTGQQNVHLFVDIQTGDCYKPANSKAPAKGIRYNLLDDKSRQEMYGRADWSGQYLYK